jgi:predicted O-methyltransferase YrrM
MDDHEIRAVAGMDAASRLDTVESDARVLEVARRHLGHDRRVTFHLVDGEAFLAQAGPRQFDFIYADTWPGKFTHLDGALSLLRVGGIYLIDGLLPQPSWPEGHAPRVTALIGELERRNEFAATKLGWTTGLTILVRTRAG